MWLMRQWLSVADEAVAQSDLCTHCNQYCCCSSDEQRETVGALSIQPQRWRSWCGSGTHAEWTWNVSVQATAFIPPVSTYIIVSASRHTEDTYTSQPTIVCKIMAPENNVT